MNGFLRKFVYLLKSCWYVQLLLAVAALGAVITSTLYFDLSKSEAAAWVQGIASVAAIWFSTKISREQAEKSAELARKQFADAAAQRRIDALLRNRSEMECVRSAAMDFCMRCESGVRLFDELTSVSDMNAAKETFIQNFSITEWQIRSVSPVVSDQPTRMLLQVLYTATSQIGDALKFGAADQFTIQKLRRITQYINDMVVAVKDCDEIVGVKVREIEEQIRVIRAELGTLRNS